jgi:hypothetical protein
MSEMIDFLVGEVVLTMEITRDWDSIRGGIRLVLNRGGGPDPIAYVDAHRCSYSDASGTSVEFDSGAKVTEAGPALGLVHRHVIAASFAKGTLSLRFDDQSELRAFADKEDYSWTVVTGEWVFHCMAGGKVRKSLLRLPALSGVVDIPTSRISDWATFHKVFAKVLGFPDFYGKNMNAWIDCLTGADEDDGMRSIVVAPGDVLTLQLLDATSFAERCPEQYEAVIECSAFVNWSRIKLGARPIIALSFYKES